MCCIEFVGIFQFYLYPRYNYVSYSTSPHVWFGSKQDVSKVLLPGYDSLHCDLPHVLPCSSVRRVGLAGEDAGGC